MNLSFSKKTFPLVFAFVFLSLSQQTKACDLCGCGASNYSLGVMPQFQKNFIGMRYRYAAFDSHLGQSGSAPDLFRTQERFHTAEIWARYYPHPKIQLLAFLPYQWNFQEERNSTKSLSGLADASLVVQYDLLRLDSAQSKFKHFLFVGGGLKLPTGNYQYNEEEPTEVANPNFQLGTGSLDFLLTLQYTLRIDNFGMMNNSVYRINTSNSNNYRFGNRANTSLHLFYIKNLEKVGWMPLLGMSYEHSQKDKRQGRTVTNTGGYLFAGSVGLQVYTGRWNLGINYDIPLEQNLAQNQIQALGRGNIQFSYLF